MNWLEDPGREGRPIHLSESELGCCSLAIHLCRRAKPTQIDMVCCACLRESCHHGITNCSPVAEHRACANQRGQDARKSRATTKLRACRGQCKPVFGTNSDCETMPPTTPAPAPTRNNRRSNVQTKLSPPTPLAGRIVNSLEMDFAKCNEQALLRPARCTVHSLSERTERIL